MTYSLYWPTKHNLNLRLNLRVDIWDWAWGWKLFVNIGHLIKGLLNSFKTTDKIFMKFSFKFYYFSSSGTPQTWCARRWWWSGPGATSSPPTCWWSLALIGIDNKQMTRTLLNIKLHRIAIHIERLRSSFRVVSDNFSLYFLKASLVFYYWNKVRVNPTTRLE